MSKRARASEEAERHRTLLEVNNAHVENLTRDGLFHAKHGARTEARMLNTVMTETAPETAVLHLEGRAAGPRVAELARACEPPMVRGAGRHLDLSAVSSVSREGVDLLSRPRDGRTPLLTCSGFGAEQLEAAGAARGDVEGRA